jgi:hypothetical protein
MWVLSTLAAALFRWCATDDLVLPLNITGRHAPELANTVGYFAYILHLRLRLADNSTRFRDLLRLLTFEYATASEHGDFGRIVQQLPQFVTRLWVQWNPPFYEEATVRGWSTNIRARLLSTQDDEPPGVNPEFAPDLEIEFSESANDVVAVLRYRTDKLRSGSVQLLKGALLAFCDEFSRKPEARIPELPRA